jgi:hypothetical protein
LRTLYDKAQDDHWLRVAGGHGSAEIGDDAIYLAMALRNVGNGIAVLDRWDICTERLAGDSTHNDPDGFRRLTRDLYVPPSDRGFWQGALRDPADGARCCSVRREHAHGDRERGRSGSAHQFGGWKRLPAKSRGTTGGTTSGTTGGRAGAPTRNLGP